MLSAPRLFVTESKIHSIVMVKCLRIYYLQVYAQNTRVFAEKMTAEQFLRSIQQS